MQPPWSRASEIGWSWTPALVNADWAKANLARTTCNLQYSVWCFFGGSPGHVLPGKKWKKHEKITDRSSPKCSMLLEDLHLPVFTPKIWPSYVGKYDPAPWFASIITAWGNQPSLRRGDVFSGTGKMDAQGPSCSCHALWMLDDVGIKDLMKMGKLSATTTLT